MKSSDKINLYLIGVALIITLGGFLFGFDIAVISGVLPFVKVQFSLSPVTEGWFVSSALVGCIAGVLFSGELSDRFGRKKMLIAASVLFLCSAVGSASLSGFTWLVLARMLGGIGVGAASIVAPLYLTEVAPAAVRGRLVTLYQLAITAGILVAYVINAALLSFSLRHSSTIAPGFIRLIFVEEVWRAMLGLGALPSLMFLTGLLFVPETPPWLIQNGYTVKASHLFSRLGHSAIEESVKAKQENHMAPYRKIFSKVMRRPLIIALLLPLFSQFSGINAVIYYGPQILSAAGLSITKSLESQMIFGAANFLFTLVAVWKVDHLGRRPLYLTGSLGAGLCLFFIGVCFYWNNTGNIWLVIGIVLFLAYFAFSIGPLKFVIAGEIFPTHIRGRAMGLSIMVMWVADTMVGQLTPLLLGKAGPVATFWFFAGCCLLSF